MGSLHWQGAKLDNLEAPFQLAPSNSNPTKLVLSNFDSLFYMGFSSAGLGSNLGNWSRIGKSSVHMTSM